MKTNFLNRRDGQQGSGLLVTIVMTAIVLATLAGALAWSSSTVRLNERANQYARSTAAAEGNTEAVISSITRDFKNGGTKLVDDNRSLYSQMALTTSNSANWAGWQFKNTSGTAGRTYVDIGNFTNTYIEIDSTYAGLKAFVCNIKVVSNARLTNTVQDVVAGVGQNFQLANIPIFQFAMFSSGYMEISCGAAFNITGKVHANGELYVEPDDALTFTNDVTAVGDILFQRHPLDTRAAPAGTVDYRMRHDGHVPALSLPIGTNNTPLAIREILQVPPVGEDTNSAIGRARYYNQVDMIVTVSSLGTISAITGIPFGKVAVTAGLTNFIAINTNFFDWREKKLVKPVDINIAAMNAWNLTNRSRFGNRDLMSLYVVDNRTSLNATQMSAVRLLNGTTLPPSGLTVATARPLYVRGNYNQPNSAHLNTTNTTATYPASLVADAITILSTNWNDLNSLQLVGQRQASNTTVNAAFLTGVVETTQDHYGGGMENFPRFMETWGDNAKLAYNGSMVKMFPSQYATNTWGATNTYDPPARNWSYDGNFNIASKLPPLTPSVQRVTRGQWATLAPNATNTAPLSL